MTSVTREYVSPGGYVNDSGRTVTSPEFWALVDRYRESGTPMGATRDATSGLSGAWIDPDGTWWRPDTMTAADLAEVKARHQRAEDARCEWMSHAVTRRERPDGTTELTLEASRYPTRAERRSGTGPVIHAAEPCAVTVVRTPADGTVESSTAWSMAKEHCGAPYTVVWQGRGWTVEVSSTYPLWTAQG